MSLTRRSLATTVVVAGMAALGMGLAGNALAAPAGRTPAPAAHAPAHTASAPPASSAPAAAHDPAGPLSALGGVGMLDDLLSNGTVDQPGLGRTSVTLSR